jgi:phytoene dehydrogenase-like protein
MPSSAAPPSQTAGDPDVIVLGSGPNGLVAACTLARAGLRVLVLEANETIGGGARTAELTLPGFRHDLCSAFHPLARVGPISELPLADHGLTWLHADRPYGGATPHGPGVALERSLEQSAALFDRAAPGDGRGWRELFDWWEWGGPAFRSLLFNPLGDPRPLMEAAPLLAHPQRALEFGQLMTGSARAMIERAFRSEDARVWLSGSVLHSDLGPDDAGGGALGLMLCGLAQQVGMPLPRGGAQAIADALTSLLVASGGQVIAGERARRIVVRDGRAVAVRTASGEYPARRAILATVQPQALFLDLVGEGQLPGDFVKLVRRFRWGTGVFVLHCALDRLPTFTAGALRGTLAFHLGRGIDTLAEGITAARNGVLPSRPLLIAGIHTLVDPSRAPEGKHTLWAMTHVPSRIRADQAGAVTAREWQQATAPFVERLLDEMECYAPGFRDSVLAAVGKSPADLEAENANLVGGDIGSGSYTLDQQVVFRPLPGWFRYKTPLSGLYMSGAATHPGGGVHGAAGANAARVLLADLRLRKLTDGLGGAGRTLVEKGRRLRRSVPASLDRWGDRRAREKW